MACWSSSKSCILNRYLKVLQLAIEKLVGNIRRIVEQWVLEKLMHGRGAEVTKLIQAFQREMNIGS